jgi:hypothetical protein
MAFCHLVVSWFWGFGDFELGFGDLEFGFIDFDLLILAD